MKVLVLNGSPKKKGNVTTLLRSLSHAVSKRHEVDWVDVYDLKMKPCIACMKCRPDSECILPEDDAHVLGRKIKHANGLVVGTPTHWGNMSAQLKLLFDRNVPVFMGEKPNGLPIPRQKGKPAAIVTACTTPWPLNFIFPESRGAIRTVREVLHYGGYRIVGKLARAGTKKGQSMPTHLLDKAQRIGFRF